MAQRVKVMDRCLLYLLDRADIRPDDPQADQLAQETIARRLGNQRAHISRAMGQLQEEGYVRTTKVRVPGEPRRRMAYALTDAGLRRAKEVRKRVEERHVLVVDLEGRESRRRLYEVPPLLPRRPRLSDLAVCVERGRIDLRRFLDRQEKLRGGWVADIEGTAPPPHFRGRSSELQQLDAFWEDGPSRALLLVGLPGVGKSTLASRWVEDRLGRVHVLWRGITPSTTAADALAAFAQFLRLAGRPALSEHLGRPPDQPGDDGRSILLRDLGPLRAILVVDDVHRATDEVCGLLECLVTCAGDGLQVKIVLVSRERPSFLGTKEVVRGRVRELEVGDLSPDEGEAMLTAMRVPEDRRGELLSGLGGHPLSLELAAAGNLAIETTRRTSVGWLAQEALSQLRPRAREALERAALFGGPAPDEIVGGARKELERLCLLQSSEGGRVEVHDLLRDAVLSGLDPERRAAIHRGIAEFLAGKEGMEDRLRSMEQFVAGAHPTQAAAGALEWGSDLITAGYADRLLRVLTRLPPSVHGGAPRDRLRLLAADAMFAMGRWAEAGKAYEECMDSEDSRVRGEALLGRGKTGVQRGSRIALDHLLSAREVFEREGLLRQLAESNYWTGVVHLRSGNLPQARESLERGRAVAFDVGDRRWEGLCTHVIGDLSSRQGEFPSAIAQKEEALALLERDAYRLEIAKVCVSLGGDLMEVRRWAEAEAFLARAVEEARSTGSQGTLAAGLYNMASLHLQRDRAGAAQPLLLEALDLFEKQDDHDRAARCAAWLAHGAWCGASEDRASAYVARAYAIGSRSREPEHLVATLRHLARAAIRARRVEDAKRFLREAGDVAREANLSDLLAQVTSQLARIEP